MTALQEAIQHFKITNSQSASSNTQIVYILEQFLEKEKAQIINAYSQGLFGEEATNSISAYAETYFKETYINK